MCSLTMEGCALPTHHSRLPLSPPPHPLEHTGKEGETFKGVAAVFDSEEEMIAAIAQQEIGVLFVSVQGVWGGGADDRLVFVVFAP